MIVELDVSKVWEKFSKSQKPPNPCSWCGCENMPPTEKEIQKAVDERRVRKEINDCDQHIGNREWHVERIAYFVKNWNDDDPIRMKKPISNMDMDDGAHRLLAALHLGKDTIQAYEKCSPCQAAGERKGDARS